MAKDVIPLGQLIETDLKLQSRDAIHIAIAPVIAGEPLKPGEHIAIKDGYAIKQGELIGIVDPFLRKAVRIGQKFFICLYPNTITSLKHYWEHPAFNFDNPEPAMNSNSRDWITKFAERLGYDYEEMIHAAKNYLRDGRYLRGGSNLEGEYVPDEFWDHFEKATGIKTAEYDSNDNNLRGNFFSCAC